MIIKGKGYIKENGERGNLVTNVKIMIPQELSKQESDLYSKLKQISKYNPRRKTN